jgi:hypothetical protein
MESRKEEKCPKGLFGKHKWITEKRLTAAGKVFIVKLVSPVCEYCERKKFL